MAENKKTFIFYSDWINMIKEMPDTDAGQLLKHILSYVNDEEPTTDNILVKMAFGHMKPMLKADLIKWDAQLKRFSDMGKKSAENRAKNKVEPTSTYVEPTSTVNDNVNVNVNDNVKVNKQLTKDVCDFFSVNEMKNFTAFKMLNAFVSVSGIDTTAFNAYKEYKLTSKEKIHGWQAFIGSREQGFQDGAWASCDWSAKIKDIPQQSNGIPSEPFGSEYQIWLRKNGQNGDSWMAACKVWRKKYEFIQPPGSTKRIWREIKE